MTKGGAKGKASRQARRRQPPNGAAGEGGEARRPQGGGRASRRAGQAPPAARRPQAGRGGEEARGQAGGEARREEAGGAEEAGLRCRRPTRRVQPPSGYRRAGRAALEGGAAALPAGQPGQGRQDRDRPGIRPHLGPAPGAAGAAGRAEGGWQRRPRRPPRLRRPGACRDGGDRGHRHRPGRRPDRPAARLEGGTGPPARHLHAAGARRAAGARPGRAGAGQAEADRRRQVRGHHGQARRRRRPGPGARRLARMAGSSPPTAAHKAEWVVPPGEAGGATHGEIVLAEPLPGRALGLRPARIVEVLGRWARPARSS